MTKDERLKQVIIQRAGKVPELKGPWPADLLESAVRELYQLYPGVLVIVMSERLPEGCYPQHGHEFLDVLDGGRCLCEVDEPRNPKCPVDHARRADPTNCSPAECWRRLTQTVPVDQPEGYSNFQDVKFYPVRAEALDGLIRRAESCDRVTAYPATQGDLISALREVRDRRASDKAIAAAQGPWWTPTLEVQRLMRWCKEAKSDTVEISAKVLEGLIHDSLLWRKDRAALDAPPQESSLPPLQRYYHYQDQAGGSSMIEGDAGEYVLFEEVQACWNASRGGTSPVARDVTKEVALMALCAVQNAHSELMHPNLAKDVQTAIDGLRPVGVPTAGRSTTDEIAQDRDHWKRLAMDRNVTIGTLGQENDRLKQESRENPWGLRRIPSAWMRIVRIASTPDQPPGEYDIECYAGDEPPEDGNKDWIPLYRRAEGAANAAPVAPTEPPPGLLMSMALRMDHGLGVPGYYDQQMFGSEAPSHKQRLEAALITARQMWEEVTGHGFYRPEKEPEYVQRQKAATGS